MFLTFTFFDWENVPNVTMQLFKSNNATIQSKLLTASSEVDGSESQSVMMSFTDVSLLIAAL